MAAPEADFDDPAITTRPRVPSATNRPPCSCTDNDTGRHRPAPSRNRCCPVEARNVIVPSGLANVEVNSLRIDSTSTGEPCARADTAADVTSGRDATRRTTGTFGSAGTPARTPPETDAARAGRSAPVSDHTDTEAATTNKTNQRHPARTRSDEPQKTPPNTANPCHTPHHTSRQPGM